MMTSQLLSLLLITPLLGFFGSLIMPKRERAVFFVALGTVLLELVLFAVLTYRLLVLGDSAVLTSLGSLRLGSDYIFAFEMYFDQLSALFLGVAILLTGLVFVFSRYYMHRERGFKRFFTTTLLFFLGLSLIILAGNFEVLFLGWEVIGISSVLLIAFYRDRFLPARNALKVFSVYRIADAFLIAAIWYAHHLFEKSLSFSELSEVVAHHGGDIAILGLLLLIAALIKSAQFPFSYWLPRAMEGPTTSSAIFYGALSVHMGLFLLLRTYPLWEDSVWLRVVIAVFGLITAIVASSITRVQSTAKTQIAYASITQIGIMFIEVAMGLHWLALLHFISNASLRTYQLLISPSIVGYLVHDQFFNFVAPAQKIHNTIMGKLRASLYVLGVKEWNMHAIAGSYLWGGLKKIGRNFGFLDKPLVYVAAIFAATAVLFSLGHVLGAAILTVTAGIAFYIRSFTTKGSAIGAWNLIMLGSVFNALFLAIAAGSWNYLALYIVPIVVAYVAGSAMLRYLKKHKEITSLKEYRGITHTHRILSHAFFVTALLFMTFPISTSFLAQDVMLSLIPTNQAFLVALFGISYVIMGVSVMRLYTKVFFGPHPRNRHERAYKYS